MRKTAVVQLTDEQRTELTERLERRGPPTADDDGDLPDPPAGRRGADRPANRRRRGPAVHCGTPPHAVRARGPGGGPHGQAPQRRPGQARRQAGGDDRRLGLLGRPGGARAWTAKLLASRAVELEVIESISESTVRRVLKKTR